MKEAEAASENLVIIEAAVFDTAPKNFFDELLVRLHDKREPDRPPDGNRGWREKCEDIIGRRRRRNTARSADVSSTTTGTNPISNDS